MQRLTRAGVGLATMGLSLLGLGMAMGNLELLVFATMPLLLLALGLASRPDGGATGARTLSTRAPRRGDVVEVALRARPAPGTDILEVHAPLARGFSLDDGSNVSLHVGGEETTTRFRVRAHARGAHELPAVRAEAIDPRGLVAPQTQPIAPPETLNVTPRAFQADKLRRKIRGRARMMLADHAEARVGVGSTDFRELRDYVWGDAPRSINWKVTARRLSTRGRRGGRGQAPLVNEYEKEGRTTLLVLLDGGADMRVGSALETGLDHAVEASLATARLFLARGARVGAATFGARAPPPAPPDAGSSQLPSLERALSPGEADPDATPARVLSTLERHMAGARPALVVVTRVTPRRAPDLVELVRRVRILVRERALPLIVIDVRALELAPANAPGWKAARAIVEEEDARAARELAAAGARIVPWRPGKEDLRAALLRRGIA